MAAKVAALFQTGMWLSRRALYHDLIRRGLMDVFASAPAPIFAPPPSPPPAPVPVPSAGPPTADAPAEPSASHRLRGRGGRPPRPLVETEKKNLSVATPVGAGAATAEAGPISIPPQPVPQKDGHRSPASAASAPAAGIHTESTWTCPACKGEFPLEERWVHKPKCPGKGPGGGTERRTEGTEGPPESEKLAAHPSGVSGPLRDSAAFEVPKVECGRCGELVETTAAAREAHFKKCPPDAPAEKVLESGDPRKPLDVNRVLARVRAYLTDARRHGDVLPYLTALVQKAVEDQGFDEPSDAEAREIVKALAHRDSEVERALRKVVA